MESILVFLAGLIGTGLMFWVTLVIFVILLSTFSEDKGFWTTVTFVACVFFLQFVAKLDLIGFFRSISVWSLLGWAVIYIVAGMLWSTIKWFSFVKGRRRLYDEFKQEYLENRGIHDVGALNKEKWAAYFVNKIAYKHAFCNFSPDDPSSIIPNVTQNKTTIIRWMTYWPFSLIYTVFDDPVRRTFEFLYRQIGSKLQAMADNAFKGTENDFLTEDDRKALRAKE